MPRHPTAMLRPAALPVRLWRAACGAALALAVLLAGAGIHPAAMCEGHAHAGAELPADGGCDGHDGHDGHDGAGGDEGTGLCLACDCVCPPMSAAAWPATDLPVGAATRLPAPARPPLPDGVVIGVDPPPVRAS